MAKKPNPVDATALIPVKQYRIVGPVQGRRRAGLQFGREPKIMTDRDLTEEALAQLMEDALLSVTEEPYVETPAVEDAAT